MLKKCKSNFISEDMLFGEIVVYILMESHQLGIQKGGGITVFSCFQTNSYCIIRRDEVLIDLVDISSV